MWLSYLLLLVSIAVVGAFGAVDHHVVHERRDSTPSGWSQGMKLHRRAFLPMRIGLTQSNLDISHDLLMEV